MVKAWGWGRSTKFQVLNAHLSFSIFKNFSVSEQCDLGGTVDHDSAKGAIAIAGIRFN